MPIFDYKCRECGQVTERFVKSHTASLRCHCGGDTDKLLSMPHVSLPPNAGFPGKDMRWIRDHEQASAKAKMADPE
jgi:putative FmdB family regulatory protein